MHRAPETPTHQTTYLQLPSPTTPA
jgi:hypothetical protein